MSNKITLGDVADMLSTSEIPPEVDYMIEEPSTKSITGCVAIVYFYEDKLSEEEQKTTVDIDSFYEQQEHERYISQSNAELERGKREVEEWRENRQLLGHDMAEAIAIQRELEEGY